MRTKTIEQINLTAGDTLENMITRWLTGDCNPDEFTAVMLAIRNCDNRLDRVEVIDRMIGYAFSQTPTAMIAESAYRKKYEGLFVCSAPTSKQPQA